jgi:outer membrane protein TolC
MRSACVRSRRPELATAGAAAIVLACACGPERYVRSADREVEALLAERTAATVGDREASAARPEKRREAPPGPPPGEAAAPEAAEEVAAAAAKPLPATRTLSLSGALEVAIQSNREHKNEQESLYNTALALTGTRFAFSPQIGAALAYAFAGSNDGPESDSLNFSASLGQRLPWGGDVSLTTLSGVDLDSGDTTNSAVALTVSQPLLRGAGHEVAWEALTQAERSMVYAIRGFELFRESFSISVAQRFYDLVQQKQALENQRRNLEGFTFGRKQAEALFSVGRTSELEVLRARRSELTSQNSLIEAEESLRLALDRFRIFLGLSDTETVDVLDEEPEFVEVDFDPESAVEVALANRLDWLTRREQLEDARRGVRIAENGLLPDLGLSLGYTLNNGGGDLFPYDRLDDASYAAALTLDIPIQQVNERNAYRSSLLSLAQAERSLAQFKDDLVVEVRSRLRELERRKQSLEIQEQLIVDQERNASIAQLRFEQGNFSNRDVVEAQQALLDAQNALIREKVAYEIARLGLLQDLGILFIDEKGMWKE